MLINKTNSNTLNPVQLLTTAQELRNSLQAIQPDNSKTSQTITFALVAVALVGVFVYHYIKVQEDANLTQNASFKQEPCSQRVLINSVKEN